MKKRIVSHSLVRALATSATAAMLLTGCVKYVDPAKYDTTVVASYNGWDITLAEANFMARRSQLTVEEFYIGYGFEFDWKSDWDTYETMEDHFKTQAMTQLLQTALLCSKAEEYGVKLSEEDKEKVEQSVESDLKLYDERMIEHGSATKEVLTKVYTNNALANRVMDYMSSDYDTTIEDEEEFRHKTVNYILLSGIAEKQNTTEEGSSEESSEEGSTEEKSAEEGTTEETKEELETDLNKVMDEIEKEFHDGKTFEDIFSDYEKKGYEIRASYLTVGKEDYTDSFGPEVFKLSTGEELRYDGKDTGLYFFYCKDDNNEEAKQDAIEDEMANRKQEHFNEKYKELTEAVEPYTVNERIWKGITFDVTLYVSPTPVPATAEVGTKAPSGESAEE